MEWIRTVRKFYQKSKRALVYIDLAFIVIVFYAGKYLGTLREQLLPAAIVGAFAIILESLFAINDSLQEKTGIAHYTSISQAVPKMIELIKQGGRRKHDVRIIASSGGTTINTILPALLEHKTDQLRVGLLVVDPDKQLPPYFPDHWASEASSTVKRLEQIAARKDPAVAVTCYTYDYAPCVHGVLIDGQHLFIGFFVWVKSGETMELSGAQQPHVYYRRTAAYENLFHLFETWFENAPRRQIIPRAEEAQVP